MPPEPMPAGGAPGDPLGSALPQIGQQAQQVGPIGVPAFTRTPSGETIPFGVPRAVAPTGTGPGLTNLDYEIVEPLYWSGHEHILFSGKSPEAKARLQLQLEEAGLLDPKEYRPGRWDKPTAEAMRGVLGYANSNGTAWEEALTELRLAPVKDPLGRKDYITRPFLAPDPEKAEGDIQKVAKGIIGRELAPDEVDAVRATYVQFERQEHAFVEDAAAFELNRQEAMADGGDVTETAPAQSVDAEARFKDFLAQRYAPETDRNQLVNDAAFTGRGLLSAITGLDRTIAGGN